MGFVAEWMSVEEFRLPFEEVASGGSSFGWINWRKFIGGRFAPQCERTMSLL